MSTHLIRGDPDSATSPSKYRSDLPDVAQTAADGDHFYFSDLPADFAPIVPASKPFRTLSTTESENEAVAEAKSKNVAQRKKSKKKRKESQNNSSGSGGKTSSAKPTKSDDVTPAMVAFLTQKDKSVSHAQIENFIHKSKVRYSVNEIQTAIKNAKAIGVETLIEPDARQEIVDKWKMMLEAIKKHDVEGETTGGTFSKSKPISISTARPAEGQTRLKLLKDVRSINKVDKLVPNTPGGHPRPETPEDHVEEQPTRTTSKPTASSAAMTSKASKGKSKTSKKDDSHTAQQTLSKDTGKKVPLALATYKKGSKKPVLEHNPTDGYFRDFKFIYVVLPEPVDELPRE